MRRESSGVYHKTEVVLRRNGTNGRAKLNEFFSGYDWFKGLKIEISPLYSVEEARVSLASLFSVSGLKTYGGSDLPAIYGCLINAKAWFFHLWRESCTFGCGTAYFITVTRGFMRVHLFAHAGEEAAVATHNSTS